MVKGMEHLARTGRKMPSAWIYRMFDGGGGREEGEEEEKEEEEEKSERMKRERDRQITALGRAQRRGRCAGTAPLICRPTALHTSSCLCT